MPRLLKYAALGLAAVIVLFGLVAAFIAATFNPNDYKPTIIRLVQEKKQRTLTIPGKITLTFFPRIGADLGRVTLSEHGSPAEFAAIDHAKVSLALLPLLSKRLVVDRVVVDGLRVHLVRYADGSTNFDDLISKDSSGQQIEFDIKGVQVGDSAITFDDRQAHRLIALNHLQLETGRIANGATSQFDVASDIDIDKPALAVALSAKSGFMLDLDRKHYVLDGLDATLKGKLLGYTGSTLTAQGDLDLLPDAKRFALNGMKLRFAGKDNGQTLDAAFDAPQLNVTDTTITGGKLSGDLKLSSAARTVSASIALPAFNGTPKAFNIPALAVDAALKDAQTEVSAKLSGALAGNLDKMHLASQRLQLSIDGKQGDKAISGSFATPLSVDLQALAVALPSLAGNLSLPNPAGGLVHLSLNGHAAVDLHADNASAALTGKLDDSSFDAKLGATHLSPLASTFDIGIDRLDLDRYRTKAAAPGAAAAGAPEKPIDLSALKTLNTRGNLHVGALTVQNLHLSNLRAGIQAAGGKATLAPLQANLYGGALAGSLALTASSPAQITLQQKLTGIHVGTLLKDAIAKDPITGTGDVLLDVTTHGNTFTQWKQGLDGSARVVLRDGMVRGINIAQVLREARATIASLRGDAGPQSGTGSSAQQTDFSELSADLRIANGIAHNDDLSAKSPLLRVTGSGDINLVQERLDYLVKASVVPTLQGQGGPELQALKGITVPVRLSGPFAAIGWKVDLAGIVKGAAQQKIDEKKDELKNQLQQKLQDKLKGLLGQ